MCASLPAPTYTVVVDADLGHALTGLELRHLHKHQRDRTPTWSDDFTRWLVFASVIDP